MDEDIPCGYLLGVHEDWALELPKVSEFTVPGEGHCLCLQCPTRSLSLLKAPTSAC